MELEGKNVRVALPVKLLAAFFSFLIISGVLALVVNPFEFIRFQRDRQRKEDLKKISLLIQQAESQSQLALIAEKKTVYISLPDSNADCATWISKGLPKIAKGFKYRCVASVNLQKTDGSGWLPINLNLLANAPLSELPVDPINGKQSKNPETGEATLYFYQYIRGSFALGAFSELRPKIDEAYSTAKKQKIAEALLGYSPIEVGVAAGGRMISAGSVDLLLEANAPSLSDEEIRINNDASADAQNEINQVKKIISQSQKVSASQAILSGLNVLGIEIEQTLINQIISDFSDKTAGEYLQQQGVVTVTEPQQESKESQPEKPAPQEPIKSPEEKPASTPLKQPKQEEPLLPPTGPACVEVDGYENPIAVCGREEECLAGACGSNAVCDVCIVP